jgi:predicted DNA-binding mobile mystery protein A
MSYQSDHKNLARENLERRVGALRGSEDLRRPPRGWIKALREALGMTTAQLAARVGVSQPNISRLEKAEVEDSVTLNTLRRVATGLNCTLVYALVPNEPLDEMIRDRAKRLADSQVARTDHTMKLENQALTAHELKVERERVAEELLRGNPRRLWDT